MRDCRDVIMLAKPGYIYVVGNGGKMGTGRQEAGRKWQEERGGKREAGRKWQEERGGNKEAESGRREDTEEMAGRRGIQILK